MNSITQYFLPLTQQRVLVKFASQVNDKTRLINNPYYTGLRAGGEYAVVTEAQLKMPYVEMYREEESPYDDKPDWTGRLFPPSDVITIISRNSTDIDVVLRIVPDLFNWLPKFVQI